MTLLLVLLTLVSIKSLSRHSLACYITVSLSQDQIFPIFKHLIFGAQDKLLSKCSLHRLACSDGRQKEYGNI